MENAPGNGEAGHSQEVEALTSAVDDMRTPYSDTTNTDVDSALDDEIPLRSRQELSCYVCNGTERVSKYAPPHTFPPLVWFYVNPISLR